MRVDRRWFVPFLVLAVSACGHDQPPTAPTPTPATFVRVDIEGPAQRELGGPGETVQLRAIATFSDGTRPDVTNDAAWSVTDSRVLTVSSRGLVTGVAVGGTIVTASYRERAGVTNVTVGPLGGPLVGVTGVVLDAESGAPIVGAEIAQSGFEDETLVLTRTDGNGFFNLGDRRGQVLFWVEQFGYEIAPVRLANVREPTRLDVRLTPNQGAYVERTVSGRFDPAPPSEASRTTLRINTRAGGVFDAIVRAPTCTGSASVLILASSGGRPRFLGTSGGCSSRLRFVVPAPDIELTLIGRNVPDWVLTYREPR